MKGLISQVHRTTFQALGIAEELYTYTLFSCVCSHNKVSNWDGLSVLDWIWAQTLSL